MKDNKVKDNNKDVFLVSARNELEGEMIRSYLKSHNILSYLKGGGYMVGSLGWLIRNDIFGARIYVLEKDKERALEVLKSIDKEVNLDKDEKKTLEHQHIVRKRNKDILLSTILIIIILLVSILFVLLNKA